MRDWITLVEGAQGDFEAFHRRHGEFVRQVWQNADEEDVSVERMREAYFDELAWLLPKIVSMSLYRGITAEDGWIDAFRQGEVPVGIHWSGSDHVALSFCDSCTVYDDRFAGGGENTVFMAARVARSSVDLDATIAHRLADGMEDEVTLLRGAPVRITSVKWNDDTFSVDLMRRA
jgi:hypothetical protein